MPNDNHTAPVPGNVGYPETLRITIASAEDAFDEALDAASAAEVGEQSDAVVSFENAKGYDGCLPTAGSSYWSR